MSQTDASRLHSAEDLLDLVRAFPPARLLLTATEFDLFSHLEAGADSADTLATAAGVDPRAAEQVLNGLAACDLLRKSQGRFQNTETTRRFLTRGSAENILARFAFQRLLWERWSRLSEALRTGRVETLPPVMERPESELREFLEALHQFGQQEAPRVVAAVEVEPAGRLLDAGGGVGTFAMEFCRRHPRMRAVLFELPQVAPIAVEKIASAGLAGRVDVRAGDLFHDALLQPGEPPFDTVFLSNVLHLFPPELNRALVRRMAGVLAPGGRLLIHDVLMEETGVRPVYGVMLSLTMLVMSEGGATYPESEVRSWLREAGLPEVSRVQVEEDIALLIAQRERREE